MMAKFPRMVHFMADKPLLEIPILGKMLEWGHVFPIDRTKSDRGALRTAMARLEAGNRGGIFPEKGIRHGKTSVLGGAELPIGTASLWKMMDVPVIPMVIIGSDQMYDWKNYFRRPRFLSGWARRCRRTRMRRARNCATGSRRPGASLFEAMKRDYDIRPEELPQSAQERWGRPESKPSSVD